MKDAFWFKHDSNAARDPKILEMKSIYGFEGYGLFWHIVEYLREQEGYKLKISEKYGFKPLAGVIGFQDLDRLTEFINDCVNEFELLELKGGYLYSNSLINRMKKWETNKANGAKGGRPKNPNKTQIKPKRNQTDNPIETSDETESKPLRRDKIREEENREEGEETTGENLWETWWDLYDVKQDEMKAQVYWSKITQEEKQKAIAHTTEFIKVTPKPYRGNPVGYIQGKKWNNEIIDRRNPKEIQDVQPKRAPKKTHYSAQELDYYRKMGKTPPPLN